MFLKSRWICNKKDPNWRRNNGVQNQSCWHVSSVHELSHSPKVPLTAIIMRRQNQLILPGQSGCTTPTEVPTSMQMPTYTEHMHPCCSHLDSRCWVTESWNHRGLIALVGDTEITQYHHRATWTCAGVPLTGQRGCWPQRNGIWTVTLLTNTLQILFYRFEKQAFQSKTIYPKL